MSRTTAGQRTVRAIHRAHRIIEARFSQNAAMGRPTAMAPTLCSCGEVTSSGAWEAHRGVTVDAARHAERKAEVAA